MSNVDRGPLIKVSMEDLTALNDEIAALVRAGIPLDQGLVSMSTELPGRVGGLADQIGRRLQAGESLVDILEREDSTIPPIWRAVVLAGARSGNLAEALQGLSETSRRTCELRRSMGVALAYPLVLLIAAYGLLALAMAYFIPTTYRAFLDLTEREDSVLAGFVWMSEHFVYWGPWPPILIFVGLLVWWVRSGRKLRDASGPARHTRWPSISRAQHHGRLATFCELLLLQFQHGVPLQTALCLAADATGDPALMKTARTMADRLERAQTIESRQDLPDGLPPLLGWAILSGHRSASLEKTLHNSADMYRRRAAQDVAWVDIYLPIISSAAIGGCVVLIHGLLVFWPMTRLWITLGIPQ